MNNLIIPRSFLLAAIMLCLTATSSEANEYRFNAQKSEVAFKLAHLGIPTATGKFGSFEGQFNFDPNEIEDTQVSLRIRSGSVLSKKPNIPKLMHSEKFFWSEKHPEITFFSHKVERLSEEKFNIHGDLSIRGIMHPAIFETRLLPQKGEKNRLFFKSHTFIHRKDYGIGVEDWRNPLMIILGESLKISLKVEALPAQA